MTIHINQKQRLECALYVVATPIGNLRDITLRALDVLSAVDVIAAEDTRNTAKLLNHYGIVSQRLMSIHKHNERDSAQKIENILQQEKSVAIVTDAGTPGISDPGSLLVNILRTKGYKIVPIPGANAAITAISSSGLTNPTFYFYGFLPNKSSERRRTIEKLQEIPSVLVFYEAPHRVMECVEDLVYVLGNEREVVFSRELTKMFENIHTCKLSEAMEWLKSDSNNQKGEFVLLVSGGDNSINKSLLGNKSLSILLKELPLKKAVDIAVEISGESRKALYKKAIELKNS